MQLNRLPKKTFKTILLSVLLTLISSGFVQAMNEGGERSGGGDAEAIQFLKISINTARWFLAYPEKCENLPCSFYFTYVDRLKKNLGDPSQKALVEFTKKPLKDRHKISKQGLFFKRSKRIQITRSEWDRMDLEKKYDFAAAEIFGLDGVPERYFKAGFIGSHLQEIIALAKSPLTRECSNGHLARAIRSVRLNKNFAQEKIKNEEQTLQYISSLTSAANRVATASFSVFTGTLIGGLGTVFIVLGAGSVMVPIAVAELGEISIFAMFGAVSGFGLSTVAGGVKPNSVSTLKKIEYKLLLKESIRQLPIGLTPADVRYNVERFMSERVNPTRFAFEGKCDKVLDQHFKYRTLNFLGQPTLDALSALATVATEKKKFYAWEVELLGALEHDLVQVCSNYLSTQGGLSNFSEVLQETLNKKF